MKIGPFIVLYRVLRIYKYFFYLCSFLLTLPGSAQKDSIQSHQLREVEVRRFRPNRMLTQDEKGKVSWHMQSIQNLPQFLGFADPVRYMQLLPGIQTAGELSSGIFMQGCETSHNLLTLNEVPLYHAMHLLGFFSIFNSGHMNHFDLQKSGSSATYGNRIGGALSMYTRDSLATRFSVEGNIGIIAAQGTLTVPVDTHSTFYLSGRGSYINLLYKDLLVVDQSELRYGFQDYNASYIWKPQKRDKVGINFYYGSDLLRLKDGYYLADGKITWNNIVASVDWERKISDSRMFKHTAYLSRYKNKVSFMQSDVHISLPSGVTDFGYKGKKNWQSGAILWESGVEYVYHSVSPQSPIVEGSYNQANQEQPTQHAHEASVFLSGRFSPLPRWELEGGFRGILYALTNSPSFLRMAGEPRFSSRFRLAERETLSFEYGIHHQYLNQVCASGLGLPTDFWVASSQDIPVQYAHSFSLGYNRSIRDRKYDFSGSMYYKKLYHQVEYTGSLIDMINRKYELTHGLHFGNGENYGAEIMVKKNQGRFTGWISYTLGWADRKFSTLNEGTRFPSVHDRRHDLSTVLEYKISPRMNLTAVFTYASGTPYTAPRYAYIIGENIICEYGPHNSSRTPDYHRLDLAFNYWFRKTLLQEKGINISLYNAYNRANPFYMDLEIEDLSFQVKSESFYGIVPSISYFFKF